MDKLASPLGGTGKGSGTPGDGPGGPWMVVARLPGLAALHEEALAGMLARLTATDPEGPDHPMRVGRVAAMLAAEFGLDGGQCDLLARAATLHDVGKLAMPADVFGHRHVLDPAARREMERHTLLGAALLAHATAPWIRLGALIALTHHERWDGSGYPDGLSGEEIPLAARLVAVADVYDALRSERPYKGAQDHDEAMRRILEGDDRIRPGQFDPAVLAALQRRAPDIALLPR
ncbi:HD domain-containing protein [Roseomonas sp. PWR1]|uniref:HD domain-containing protein n=1 Tax=Roseomonas nitratireducens TaxID=2820810 RepID=A0ABS4AQT7_9PROT|nr:HD domain-containing phosphohydrolase [Neoroseomonas nitratireducens]MBP0462927.1 HD domain-containing protein [Neoroseomonas nitratireducens]